MPKTSNDIIKSVVQITGNTGKFGTGFVFASENGEIWILTCAHVVRDVGGRINVRIKDQRVMDKPIEVLACGEKHEADLAVLKTTEKEGEHIPVLKLGLGGNEDLPVCICGFAFLYGEFHKAEPLKGTAKKIVVLQEDGGPLITAWKLLMNSNNLLEEGYSGSPVVSVATQTVFAIASISEYKGERGYAVSLAHLQDVWSAMPQELLGLQQVAAAHPQREQRNTHLETTELQVKYKEFVDLCDHISNELIKYRKKARWKLIKSKQRPDHKRNEYTWLRWSKIWLSLDEIFGAELVLYADMKDWINSKYSEGSLSLSELDFCLETLRDMDYPAQEAKLDSTSAYIWMRGSAEENGFQSVICAVCDEHRALERELKRSISDGRCPSELIEYLEECIRKLNSPLDALAATLRAKKEEQVDDKDSASERKVNGFTGGRALIIGVGDYPHAQLSNLPATVSDAEAIGTVLTDPARCGYLPGKVEVISGSKATVSNIRSALHSLSKYSNLQSTVLVYFSGHGGRVLQNERWHTYLCPRDTNPADFSSTSISGNEFSELLAAIPARKMLVIIDACHAGGIVELKTSGVVIQCKAGLSEDYYEALAQGNGRVVLASSKEDQVSHVRGKLSLFTHYLVEALGGGATVRGDGLIHVLDVFHYVNETVQQEQPGQIPILKVKDLDLNFPIALDRGGKGVGLTQVLPTIVAIREQIIHDPLNGAKALSEYLMAKPDLADKLDEVDLKRAELVRIQQERELFDSISDNDKVIRNRTVFFLLRVCHELEEYPGL
ncbi:MAG: hypothetical protein BA865_08425 [Desulfobacterales bacterium S5133MH4]|nr:MAG: hypothetical protein BA865_08425 [Desulfobacterales bacterium S5133MH4]